MDVFTHTPYGRLLISLRLLKYFTKVINLREGSYVLEEIHEGVADLHLRVFRKENVEGKVLL